MRLRLLTAALVAAAVAADAAAAHGAAHALLVAAVPAAALAALGGLGGILDRSAAEPLDRAHATLAALVLPFLVAAAALRAPLLVEGPPPGLAVTALACALALVAVQGLLAAAAAFERLRLGEPLRGRGSV